MSVSLETPTIYRSSTGNETKFELEGKTIGEMIERVLTMYPETRKLFLDKDGNVLPSFCATVNGQQIYPVKNDMPVNNGDKVTLMVIFTGG